MRFWGAPRLTSCVFPAGGMPERLLCSLCLGRSKLARQRRSAMLPSSCAEAAAAVDVPQQAQQAQQPQHQAQQAQQAVDPSARLYLEAVTEQLIATHTAQVC